MIGVYDNRPMVMGVFSMYSRLYTRQKYLTWGHSARPCVTIPAIVTPSRPLHHHPRRCGSVRRQGPDTPATVPRTAPRQRHPRVLTRTTLEQTLYAATLEAAPGRAQDAS
jgi:hypothetical protein